MQVLILGSEGFIGGHAAAYFRNNGHKVTCADIVLKQEENYFVINPELPDFSKIFRSAGFDVCINATGAANVQLSFAYPAMDYVLNAANVYHILDSIRLNSPGCRFINLSSAAVYGNPVSLPISEAHAVQPLSPYGFHKWHSEQICRQFYDLYNIGTMSLRIFSAYGEGLKKQLFWDLYKKVSENSSSVELFGTGKESRDFIHVHDIIRAIDCIISKADFNGGVVNIGSGTESTIESIAGIFIKSLGKTTTVVFRGNSKEGDPLNWRADITKLRTMGFEQQTSLEDGISKYAGWDKQF